MAGPIIPTSDNVAGPQCRHLRRVFKKCLCRSGIDVTANQQRPRGTGLSLRRSRVRISWCLQSLLCLRPWATPRGSLSKR